MSILFQKCISLLKLKLEKGNKVKNFKVDMSVGH